MLLPFWSKTPESQRHVTLLVAAVAAGLYLAAPAESATPGMTRCGMLEHQVTTLVKSKNFPGWPDVKRLRTQAQNYCSKGKTAQGLRTYVKALELLHTKPVLPKD